MAKYCVYCGKEIDKKGIYCGNCGNPLYKNGNKGFIFNKTLALVLWSIPFLILLITGIVLTVENASFVEFSTVFGGAKIAKREQWGNLGLVGIVMLIIGFIGQATVTYKFIKEMLKIKKD